MLMLVVGLVIFICVHSIRVVAPNWRDMHLEKTGLVQWRTRFILLSVLSLALIVLGYQKMRLEPIWLWFPPIVVQHISALVMLVALFALGSAMIPKTSLKSKMGYPFLIAVKLWAFAHLMSNGTLADVILFGSLLVWSVVSFAVYRRRDRRNGVVREEGGVQYNLMAFVFAMVSWFAIVFFLHKAVIGVSPLV
ncbi:NnrU family protein [Marinomonas sp. TW1]|uniref:NnrU family protein n=1 Tax=Marinomonas sp. TW1 TaxID=1561203 RepID=UPI0007AFCC76|nr:NnrU family protein [Marinomonas sp. TW1]KZN13995.1 NnrU family protein [Marinomonas sp. TW1]